MVPPNGVWRARSWSTWIHWWSPVTSAKVSTSFWVTSCQSETPRTSPSAALSSSSPVIVRMAGHHTSRRVRPAPVVRYARPALPRLLRAARLDQGRRGPPRECAGRLGEHDALVHREVPAAGVDHVLRAGVGGLPRGGLPGLPRRPARDARRPRLAVGARGCAL